MRKAGLIMMAVAAWAADSGAYQREIAQWRIEQTGYGVLAFITNHSYLDNPTFLDMRAYGKGQVWVNGHALGRYWRVGPQGGLYLPGAWLHPGRNEVVLLDLDGGAVPPLSGVDHALIDEPIRAER